MANEVTPTSRPQWSTRFGFIMAAAGSAIGLGNVWKFPYITGQNGGGAFVLVYLVCIVAVGLPIMIAELMIGRHTRRDAVGAFNRLAGRRSPWLAAGWISISAAFIILSYYSVVAGWTFDYIWLSLQGSFSDQPAAQIEGMFGQLTGSGSRQLFWHALFMLATLGIVLGGVQKGLERWNKILMPLLFLLMGILVVNGLFSKGAWEGITFMFRPDFSRLSAGAVLEGMGHSFFTLSLGMAAMITYGSYLDRREDLLAVSLRIVFLDTLIALMAGVAIFAVVFSVGMGPAAGPGLVFKTIPVVFSQVPGGYLLAILFFILLAFAALTSSISLLEAQVAYLIDERGWPRRRATLLLAGIAFIVGIPSALSSNLLDNWQFLGERSFFDSADLLATNYLLPTAGLLIAIYVGWFWSGDEEKEELIAGGSGSVYPVWHFVIRFISPAAVAIVLFYKARESGLFAWLAGMF